MDDPDALAVVLGGRSPNIMAPRQTSPSGAAATRSSGDPPALPPLRQEGAHALELGGVLALQRAQDRALALDQLQLTLEDADRPLHRQPPGGLVGGVLEALAELLADHLGVEELADLGEREADRVAPSSSMRSSLATLASP
jgi:hypothetical protein